MINALFTTLSVLGALELFLALLLLIPGVSYPVVALAKLSQAPGGTSSFSRFLTLVYLTPVSGIGYDTKLPHLF